MAEYHLNVAGLGEILGLLSKLLNVRVTFFDRDHAEVPELGGGRGAAYCRRRRKAKAFDARCRACDAHHLAQASRERTACIYRCHAGLLEGAVPLYNRRELYLGSIVFGQVRAPESAPPRATPGELSRFRAATRGEMEEIAQLLKMTSEHILERELIHYRPAAWLRKVETYVDAHWREKIRLAELARHVGCSASWLSHHFPLAFGAPLRTYLRNLRLRHARRLVEESDLRLGDVADRTGFYDEFHLSRAFKRRYGHAPSTLRRRAPL